MELRWQGRVAGEFLGYAPGRVFELSSGERWRQEDHTDEPCWRENPKARMYWDQSLGYWYLDIEGTSATVRVSLGAGRRGVGAF